jgi:hypothetical protein
MFSPASLDTNEPPATPIRQPAYAQLSVSSTDRYNNHVGGLSSTTATTSSSFIFQRQGYLLNGYFTRLALTQVQFQYNLPTIVATTDAYTGNEKFVIVYPSGYTSLSQQIVQVIQPGGGSSVTMTMPTSLGAGAFTVGEDVGIVGTVTTTASLQGQVLSWTAGTGILVINPVTNVSGFTPNPPAQTWSVTSPANNYTISITQGFYTPSQLAAAIQAAVQTATAAATFTCTWNTPPNYNVFTFTDTSKFQFGFPQSLSTSYPANEATRFYNTIGATPNMFSPAALTMTSGIPTMQFTRWIDLCSSGLTKFQRVKDSTTLPVDSYTTTLARLYSTPPGNPPIDTASTAGKPGTWTVDFQTPKYIKWDVKEVLSNFDLQLKDEYGTLLWWSPQYGCEYAFTLLASES